MSKEEGSDDFVDNAEDFLSYLCTGLPVCLLMIGGGGGPAIAKLRGIGGLKLRLL